MDTIFLVPVLLLAVVAFAVFGLVKLFSNRQARETAKVIILLPFLVLGSLLLAFLVLAALYFIAHVEIKPPETATVLQAQRSDFVVKLSEREPGPTPEDHKDHKLVSGTVQRSEASRVLHAMNAAFVSAVRAVVDEYAKAQTKTAGATPPDAKQAAGPSSAALAEKATPAAKRPSWVDNPPQPSDGPYEVVVVAGPWKTGLECEKALSDEVDWAVDNYIGWKIGEDARGYVSLPQDYVRRSVIQEQWLEKVNTPTFGEMFNLHALLRFDGQTEGLLRKQWNAMLVTGRIAGSGAILGAVLLLLTVVFAYLKIDLATGGAYRWRLRLAAVGVVLAMVAAGAALLSR